MKKQSTKIVTFIILLPLLCSRGFANITEFFVWLFTLQYATPDISIAGEVIVRFLVFVASYGIVGFLFNLLGWFNRKWMSLAYFITSTLLGFVLAYIVWTIEKYILVIAIVFGVVLLGVVAYFAIRFAMNKRQTKDDPKEKKDNI